MVIIDEGTKFVKNISRPYLSMHAECGILVMKCHLGKPTVDRFWKFFRGFNFLETSKKSSHILWILPRYIDRFVNQSAVSLLLQIHAWNLFVRISAIAKECVARRDETEFPVCCLNI